MTDFYEKLAKALEDYHLSINELRREDVEDAVEQAELYGRSVADVAAGLHLFHVGQSLFSEYLQGE